MYGFFDKHGKKFLAVAAVLLIVVMLLPPTAGNYGGGGSTRLGSVDGEPLDIAEINGTHRSLELLDSVIVRTGQGDAPLLAAVFPDVAAEFRSDPRLYYLLVNEAQANGVIASEADVADVLRNAGTRVRLPQGDSADFASIEASNAAYARSIEDAVRGALSVFASERHAQRTVKISAPAVRQSIARQTQEARVRVLPFDAAAMQSGIPAPSEAQLTEQFNAFAAIKPGTTDAKTNPFGFGYRVPDRVKIDIVEVPLGEVRRAVEATKSPEEWEEEAQVLYLRDPSKFAAIATQPAATQATQSTQPTQASGPTTRPFAEAKADMLEALRKPLIEQRRRAVVGRVQQQLAGDYAIASDKGAATTQKVEAATPAFGVPYASFEYLEKVRDNVQRQFGVSVTVKRESALQSEAQLAAHPLIGSARVETTGSEMPRSAAAYVFQSLAPLHTGDANTASGLINLYEPTKPLTTGGTGDDLMSGSTDASIVLRVTAVDPSHPPTAMADVQADVEKDVRRKLAFEKATTEAEAALKAVGATLSEPNVVTSGWFKSSDFTLPGIEPAIGPDSYLLIGPALELMSGVTDLSQLPVRKVVPIYSANRVCVIELFDVRATKTADELALLRQAEAVRMQQSAVQRAGLRQSWFDRDSVFRRTKFEPAEGAGDSEPQAPAAPRRNPLMP